MDEKSSACKDHLRAVPRSRRDGAPCALAGDPHLPFRMSCLQSLQTSFSKLAVVLIQVDSHPQASSSFRPALVHGSELKTDLPLLAADHANL